jgi:calcineurin-like phosphoesterase family protein
MIEAHNSVVKPGHIFYDLGDVTFRPKDFGRIASRLNGDMRLLVGNHDDPKNYELTRWFRKIGIWRLFKEQNIIFSHIPLREDQFRYKVQFCGHGHIHQNLIDDPRYINLCVEHNPRPLHMDELIAIMKSRQELVGQLEEKRRSFSK